MLDNYLEQRNSLHKDMALLAVGKEFGDEYTYVVSHIQNLNVETLEQANKIIEDWFEENKTKHFHTFDKDEAFGYPNPKPLQTKIYHSHAKNFLYTLPLSEYLGGQRGNAEVISNACFTAYLSLTAAYLAKHNKNEGDWPHDDFPPPPSSKKKEKLTKRVSQWLGLGSLGKKLSPGVISRSSRLSEILENR